MCSYPRGEYVIKELESLYQLRKYRALKQRYYEEPPLVPPPVASKKRARHQNLNVRGDAKVFDSLNSCIAASFTKVLQRAAGATFLRV